MRVVGAEIAGLDSNGQMASERRNDFPDLLDGLLDSLGDRRAGPFGVGPDSAVHTAAANGRAQLLGDGMHLVSSLGSAFAVIESFGFRQVFAQLVKPPPV